MPIALAPLLPGIISGAASLIGGGINAISQARQNRKSQDFSKQMYQRQYDDSLTNWNRVNEYNHPAQQMKRVQQAGLSPALMYGKSASSGNAGSISTPDVQAAQFRSPELGSAFSSMIDSYYDTQIKQAQTDNLRLDGTVKAEEALLKQAQRGKIEKDTERSAFDLALDSELRNYTADMRRENARKMKAEADLQTDENTRRNIANSATVAEAVQRIAESKAREANTKEDRRRIRAAADNAYKDGRLKDLDIALKEKGVQPSDHIFFRIAAQAYESYMDRSGFMRNLMKDAMKDFNPFRN